MRRRLLTRAAALAVPFLVLVVLPGRAQEPSQVGGGGTFWQRLGDSTLTRLAAEALRANRDVVAAQARIRQARAARNTATLDFFPTVTVGGGYLRQRTSRAAFGGLEIPERGLWDGEVRVAWEVDVFGRLRGNTRGQGALAESAREAARDVERLVSAELALAYYDLRGARAQLEVAQRNAENQRNTLQLTRDRLEAGRGTAFDTERAEAQLATTLALVPLLEARLAAARHRIGILIGRDPEQVPAELGSQVCELPELPEDIVGGSVDSLIRGRPDVRAAERRVAAERAFVGAAKADYLPRLTLGGTLGFTSTGFDSLGRSGTGRYAVGPQVSWPAFNLGRVKLQVDAARALEAEARARYDQTVLLAREELASARVIYTKARERLAQLTRAAEASAQAAELARIRFQGGVADFLQVLDAERTLLLAQDELERGRTAAIAALIAVYRATGEGQ